MPLQCRKNWSVPGRRAVASGVMLLALSGCTHFWEDATAYDPHGTGWRDHLTYRWQRLTDQRDPMEVLLTDKDHDLRARAIRSLKEPLANGGTEKEQQDLLVLLSVTARAEKEPTVCRLAAVEKLGEFKDQQATQKLLDAFHAKVNVAESTRNPVVQMAALDALARRRDPAAIETLTDSALNGTHPDICITASKGLANFENYQAVNALVRVLEKEKQKEVREKNMALRYQANASLQQITGKELPPDPEAWQQYLLQAPADRKPAPTRDQNPWLRLTSWFQDEPGN